MSVRSIVILYGSETGTAQDVAERIERDAIRRHFRVIVKPLDQYDVVRVVTNYQFHLDIMNIQFHLLAVI